MASHKQNLGVLRRIGSALISARARAIMSIGIVLGLGAVGTLAAWSDTSTATSGLFTTGRIDIQLNGSNNVVTLSTLSKLTIVPGDTVASNITVNNAGTVPFNYKVAAATSVSAIDNLFTTSFYDGAAAAGTAPTSCGGTLVGTTTAALTTTSQNLKLGATDTNLLLPAGQNKPMCMTVSMPTGTLSPSSAASGVINYVFTATST